jgi:hypothetical protein
MIRAASGAERPTIGLGAADLIAWPDLDREERRITVSQAAQGTDNADDATRN